MGSILVKKGSHWQAIYIFLGLHGESLSFFVTQLIYLNEKWVLQLITKK